MYYVYKLMFLDTFEPFQTKTCLNVISTRDSSFILYLILLLAVRHGSIQYVSFLLAERKAGDCIDCVTSAKGK